MGYATVEIFAASKPAALRKAQRVQKNFNRRFLCESGLTMISCEASAQRKAKWRVRLVFHLDK